MNILYLTISNLNLKERGLYQDLINGLKEKGHNMTLVMANEARVLKKTIFSREDNIDVLRIKVGNLFGANFIKKGINNILIEKKFKKGIKNYLKYKKFDLILYATPPVTFANVIEYLKKQYNCKTYLMLKDIFPQNAVDIGLFKDKGIIHKFFRKKEKKLYKLSDFIGCMSKKNIEYLLKNNKEINEKKVELFPNTINISNLEENIPLGYRKKYGVKDDCILYVFGGNLGKPQGLSFLMNGIKSMENYNKAYFFIVGDGSEKEDVKNFANKTKNITFIDVLPKEEYESLIKECDVGILSLDYRFTIPNYPSRTLSYMDKGMPILACTDKNTDIKDLIEKEAKCGKWCYSNDIDNFKECIEYFYINKEHLKDIGLNGRIFLEENFNVKKSISILENHFN
ncbi:glycosyltransferase involved in cell wall biosynthesis [Clostridium moniliforme]|uniref:Glycosyltransferase involved in cell wall biosynthesis n=1 Tax=Clostridium moniliforme TaxID=39489 RepID=A0ABS4EYU1_9CLOT|nr:glycosyltransferase family 4 protein [Clostridium moniliforme]MBP1889164.1 glycosyltransferase involved in cell wall biosynthesis [Clostridium moniliforme]